MVHWLGVYVHSELRKDEIRILVEDKPMWSLVIDNW